MPQLSKKLVPQAYLQLAQNGDFQAMQSFRIFTSLSEKMKKSYNQQAHLYIIPRQCLPTTSLIPILVHILILPQYVKSKRNCKTNGIIVCVCMCACACARVCMCVCVYVCRGGLDIQPNFRKGMGLDKTSTFREWLLRKRR